MRQWLGDVLFKAQFAAVAGKRYDNIISAFVQLSGEERAGNAKCKNCAKVPIYPQCISRPDIQKGSCGCCIYNKNASRCSLRGDDNDAPLPGHVESTTAHAARDPSYELFSPNERSDGGSQKISGSVNAPERHTARSSVTTLKSRVSTTGSSLEEIPATGPLKRSKAVENNSSLTTRTAASVTDGVAQQASGSTSHHTKAAETLLARTIGVSSDSMRVPSNATANQDTIVVAPRRSASFEPGSNTAQENLESRATTTSEDLYTSTPARVKDVSKAEILVNNQRSPSPEIEIIYPQPAASSTTLVPKPNHNTASTSGTAQSQPSNSHVIPILSKADQRRILCRAFCTFKKGETKIRNMNFRGCETFDRFVSQLTETRNRALDLKHFCYSLPPHEEDYVIDAEDLEAYQDLLMQAKELLRDMPDNEILRIRVNARL
ncbi:uncharacterized protein MYCFIDRAFT_192894 [Pseudocercospora fijiensis CIRAD86]|uniref:Uncharacterized protein n=1 Tax=Pseudocercospora fijiensis (strain CIRAD86) TaxID=383855 RepID=N1QBZ3_PSEFD|nr:uncharacterized protein MYCFIDRAFT_192894 [Pseudocercospora fijiensis CIRAD86]EME88822.1 hypothetical protein MYCFIDRAFT_192894 [Pseudocercospora fijiensis CIRAD86]